MYPWLLPDLFNHLVPLYELFIIIGAFLMLIYIMKRLDNHKDYSRVQTNRLLVILIASLLFALFFSWLLDGVFHSIQEGELSFGTITFIGGLIGGVGLFLPLYHYFFNNENSDLRTLMNIILTGVVLAHAFGRIGCFFAGCCFGIPTDSFLGVEFPHGHAHSLYPGTEVFPTQLFEAAFLFILFFLLNGLEFFKNKQIEIYLIAYGLWRFLIEFIRGDDRGELFTWFETEYNVFPTPSQFFSFIMLVAGIYLYYRWNVKSNNNER